MDKERLNGFELMNALVQFHICKDAAGEDQMAACRLLGPALNVGTGGFLQDLLDACCEIFPLERRRESLLNRSNRGPIEYLAFVDRASILVSNKSA